MTLRGSTAAPDTVLGIDIGGSHIKGAPVDVGRGVLLAERVRVETPSPAWPEAVGDVVGELVRRFQWQGPVGCAFPAVIREGTARTATNVDRRWIGTNGRALFEKHTGCRVGLINDADAAGLAEVRFGAGRERAGLTIMLTLGTGIGSALFMDGVLIPNTELGDLPIDGEPAEHRASALARKRDKLSWDRWSRRLDTYLHWLQRLLAPRLFILGGGISRRHQEFLSRLTVEAEVVPAELRNNAGIVGAALPFDTESAQGE